MPHPQSSTPAPIEPIDRDALRITSVRIWGKISPIKYTAIKGSIGRILNAYIK